jgi:hypothetical protein
MLPYESLRFNFIYLNINKCSYIVGNVMMDLGEVGGVMWTGLIWLRIGTGGELL